MKIGLFINDFRTTERYKDPGVIAHALKELGHELTVYCLNTEINNPPTLLVKKITREESRRPDYWSIEKNEAVIVYSWLSLRFTPLIKAIKTSGAKIILKLDSDGRLLYPLLPSYLRVFGLTACLKDKLIHVLRLIQWYVFPKIISRRRLSQLDLAEAAIIESPLAKKNLQESLDFWQRSDLTNKLTFIPNPLSPEISTFNLTAEKNNLIVSIARWSDRRKNAAGLVKTLSLVNLPISWAILLIGSGSAQLKDKIKAINPRLTIQTEEVVSHQQIFSYLGAAKILFVPSLAESFNLAAVEALGCGCSLVTTPLESFRFFTANGQFGTLSEDEKTKNLLAALTLEIAKWDQNLRQPQTIGRAWRETLDAGKIGREIEALIKSL